MSAEDREIKIRAVLSSAEFDKGVDELKRKLQKLNNDTKQMSSTTGALKNDTMLGKYAASAFGDFSKESQKQLEQMYQVQRREAADQKITLKGKQEELSKIATADAVLTKQQKERVDLLKTEIDLLKSRHRETLNQAAQVKQVMGESGGGGTGGGNGPTSAEGSASPAENPLKKFLNRSMISSLVGGAINAAVTSYGDVISRDRKILGMQGATTQAGAEGYRNLIGGRATENTFFSQQRSTAASMALQERNAQGGLFGKDSVGIMGRMGIGAAMGAAGGSIIPGVGTLAGAAVGAIGGFRSAMSSERNRALLFDKVKYNNMLNVESMQNYEGNLASLKAKDPVRTMAYDFATKNADHMGAMQKALGLQTDEAYYGNNAGNKGLLRSQMDSGNQYGGVMFNANTIEQNMMGIQQAGGTTVGGAKLSGFSAGLQRQMNLSNSNQILGRLSGAGLNETQTEDATKRILAEAVRLGVDTSSMPKEMERMTAVAAEMATAGGGFSGGAVETLMAGMTGFDQTSINASANAADRVQQAGKAAGGYEGQMGLGYLMSGKATKLAGKKLGSDEMNYLNQFSYSEGRDEDYTRIASYLGTTPEDAKELIKQKDLAKQTRSSKQQNSMQALGDYMKANSGKTPDEMNQLLATGEGGKLMTSALVSTTASEGQGFSGMTQAQQEALVKKRGAMTAGIDGFSTDAIENAMQKNEGRVSELNKASQGQGDLANIDAFNKYAKDLRKAASDTTEETVRINEQLRLFRDAVSKNKNATEELATALKDFNEKLKNNKYTSTKPI